MALILAESVFLDSLDSQRSDSGGGHDGSGGHSGGSLLFQIHLCL